MKHVFYLLAAISCAILLSACNQQNSPTTKIGIIVPLQHKAMTEIVTGFTEAIKKKYPKSVEIKVANAQADVNLQRAIIQQMRDQSVDVIVPIGMDASQMTIAMAKHNSIVSLASDLSEKDRRAQTECHVAVVHDEISPVQLMQFIHEAYPQIRQVTLIHSAANKVFPQVATTVDAGKKIGVTVNTKMVSTLPELMAAAQQIPSSSQAILVLKDHLIVSGIGTLKKIASNRQIPLITSDQGSVQEGAGFALGVHEREIGEQGGMLVAKILEGQDACQLPIVEMSRLTVFINRKALQETAQAVDPIVDAAKTHHFAVEYIG